MVMNSRHVALLALAAFVAGGALTLAAVLFISAQSNSIRLAAQRDTLLQQNEGLVSAVRNSAAEKGRFQDRLSLATRPGRDAEEELRDTISDLRQNLDQNALGTPAEQLAACRRVLEEQTVAASSYVTALNLANERVAALSNALENIGHSQTAQSIRLQTDQKLADALDDANARIAALSQDLQQAGSPAPAPVLATVPPSLPPPSVPAILGVSYVGPHPFFNSPPQHHHDRGSYPAPHSLPLPHSLATGRSGF